MRAEGLGIRVSGPLSGTEKGLTAGVETAIGSMKVKESARVVVKPQYGFGDEGCAEFSIPGGAELQYEVRLNNFTKVGEKGNLVVEFDVYNNRPKTHGIMRRLRRD